MRSLKLRLLRTGAEPLVAVRSALDAVGARRLLFGVFFFPKADEDMTMFNHIEFVLKEKTKGKENHHARERENEDSRARERS